MTAVTHISHVVLTADEKTWAFAYQRMTSQLFLVEGAR